ADDVLPKWSFIGTAIGPALPPADGLLQRGVGPFTQRREHRRSMFHEDHRAVFALAHPKCVVTHGIVVIEAPVQIAAKPNRSSAKLNANSQRAAMGPLTGALPVFRCWSIYAVQTNFSFHALNHAQHLAVGQHVFPLIRRVIHWHAVEHAQLSRFGLKFGFENVRARKISPRGAVLARRRNAPEAAFLPV